MNTRTQACDALYASGFALLEQGRLDDASVLFRSMLVADSGDERGWLALGTCHERLQHLAMAEELYAAGAHLARKKTRCILATARILTQLGDARADGLLEQAERHATDDDEIALAQAEAERSQS
jgi:thioredoxin-like negative regulator of GroEL